MAVLNPNTFIPNESGFAFVLHSMDGPVGRELSRRATLVQMAAKAQIAQGNGGWSSEGNRTGNLSSHVVKRPTMLDGNLAVQVGAWGVPYAEIVHEGRPGISKLTTPPAGTPKKPFLVFKAKGMVIFTKKVGPAAPNRYLSDNLHLAVD